MENGKFYKNEPTDRVWWLDNREEAIGVLVFSFDKKEIFYLFQDYPWKLTKEQKEIFDMENPFWADFFASRSMEEK